MPFSDYLADQLGHFEISPSAPIEAGSHVALLATYTAGRFGIDDSGGLKLSWRTASDSGKPQFSDPRAPNYVTAEASNGAGLAIEYNRNNIRPWVNTILVRMVGGYLKEGDRIEIRIGDRSKGSLGYRIQTCCDRDFQFKPFIDAFATYDFVPLPHSPRLELRPGPVARWKAYLPTLCRRGEAFRLAIVSEDRWGNPTDLAERTVRLVASGPVAGLPEGVTVRRGEMTRCIEVLRAESCGELLIELVDDAGTRVGRSNALRIVEDVRLNYYWGDLHGQSNETVGTNSIDDYFDFARNRAFLDMVAHQGNDFQIDDAFWNKINQIADEYDDPGRFVALPSYEWSGNTAVGGDHNVYYFRAGRPIFRSSAVLLEEGTFSDPICPTSCDLFAALGDEEAVVIAHVGGRYADLSLAHDPRTERAVEIHSCWGTFEWLLHDAFDLGLRVGVVCHSDDHKGRPGAAYPGAATFGAIGGLTCYRMPTLDRDALLEALRERKHYGTTGARIFLDINAEFGSEADIQTGEMEVPSGPGRPARTTTIGDIVTTTTNEATLNVDISGTAPIERVSFFNGRRLVGTSRPHGDAGGSRRVRVVWEGAAYRGRNREVFWKGTMRITGNSCSRVSSFNFFNVDKPALFSADGRHIEFDNVTTGNLAGIDIWLGDTNGGMLQFRSKQTDFDLNIADITGEDWCLDLGGLGKRIRVFRLPEEMTAMSFTAACAVALVSGSDNPLYARVTQEDGHQAWSSPIYVHRHT